MIPKLVRPARQDDLPKLRQLELAAAERFTKSDLPPPLRGQTLDAVALQEALDHGLLWVAEAHDALVGFVAAREEGSDLHLLEVSVVPDMGRQGLGRGLLEVAVHEAARRGLAAVTLTTFSHIAWNGPAYARAGFRELDESSLTPALRRRLDSERALGLRHRIAMQRLVGG